MNWAGIVLLIFFGISLLIYAHMHGKPKTGNWNFWIGLISSIIEIGLMYFAGLF